MPAHDRFVIPPVAPPPVSLYSHLPPHLAQAMANLPPLNPPGQRRRRNQVNASASASASASVSAAPAPAPAPVYRNLPPHLAQQLSTLVPFPQGAYNRNPIPTPLPLGAALPVCFYFF